MRYKIYVLLIVTFFFAGQLPAWAFSDLEADHPAYDSVQILSAKDWLAGYPDGSFRPDQALSRAEASLLLAKALLWEEDARELVGQKGPFRDLAADHWASPYLSLLEERGLIKGYGDGRVGPDQTIRRIEWLSLLSRALSPRDKEVQVETVDQAHPLWAQKDLALARQTGLLARGQRVNLNEKINRDQATRLLLAYLEKTGQAYDFWAYYQAESDQGLSLKVNGNNRVFRPTKSLKEKIEKEPFREKDLVRGVLTPQGQLAYLEKTSLREVEDLAIQLTRRPQPEDKDQTLMGERPVDQEEEVAPPRLRVEESFPYSPLEEGGYSLEEAKAAAGLVHQAMGIREGWQAGHKQVVAIIDSGVDPGLASLRELEGGQEKMLGFYDLTDEGRIDQEGVLSKSQGRVELAGQTISLEKIASRSGRLPYGYLKEEKIGIDLDQDGRFDSLFLAVFADPQIAGRYQEVHLQLGQAAGEDQEDGESQERRVQVMTPYQTDQEVYSLSGKDADHPFRVVLAEIAADGSYAKVGFDANGHGTAVASAALGTDLGLAPQAQLLVIKAFDKDGSADWQRVEEAIQLAVQKGATVVNMSLGYQDLGSNGRNSLTYLADHYHRRYGVVFVGAAGNQGPGLASLSTPANGQAVLGVAAYLPQTFAKKVLGYPIDQDLIWLSGSRGPRLDGHQGIDVAAPGLGLLARPAWQAADYGLVEGSSVASAYMTGALASFLSQPGPLSRKEKEENFISIVRDTAKDQPAWTFYEGGQGQVDCASWADWDPPRKDLRLLTWQEKRGPGPGIYERALRPASQPIYLYNDGLAAKKVYWYADDDWLKADADYSLIQGQSKRTLTLSVDLPQAPGLYSSRFAGYTDRLGGFVSLPFLAVVPQPLEEVRAEGGGLSRKLRYQAVNRPGRLSRQFFEVKGEDDLLQGIIYAQEKECHYWLYDGQGLLSRQGYLHQGEMGNFFIENPTKGIWEMVVAGALTNARGQLDQSRTDIRIDLASGPGQEDQASDFFVGNLTQPLSGQKDQWISLSFRDTNLRPLKDRAVFIQGRRYVVEDGLVRLRLDPDLLAALKEGQLRVEI